MAKPELVCVVDDDPSVRESLPDLLRTFGFDVQAFSSAEAYLVSGVADATDCLVLDVSMPGMSGPDLHRELKKRRSRVPIVFMTAHAHLREKLGLPDGNAVSCLLKPFNEQSLVQAIRAAIGTS